jgi:Tol biopolymer transport system component/serine/threonine protein kinase
MQTGKLAHYEIVEEIGSGGMGVVYKARDTHLDRFVAVKVLPQDKVADADRRLRFIQEAKAATSLNHPNIVVIHDVSEVSGVHFIAMEYVAGKTLQELIPRKGLRLNAALKYAMQIADALAAAHRAGILHRDIKPGNIMVTDDGRVKILDFGLAKLTEAAPSEDEATATLRPQTGEEVIVGTAAYMSPEQAQGRKLDGRSDIFSFGCVLYEMVTGQRAFKGDSTVATLSAILNEQPKPPGAIAEGVPADLEKIIARCMRKDPDRRFHSMADVLNELREVAEESESGAALRAVHRPRRRWAWAAAGLGALAVGAGAWVLWQTQASGPAGEAPTATPLTTYSGMEFAPAFSPDGNQVAFAWNGEKQDNYEIYVKLIGPGLPLRLTNNPNPDFAPAWSPDGRWIAFRRNLGGGKAALLLVPALGGPERKIADIAIVPESAYQKPSWHPDGSWIALCDRGAPDQPVAIHVLSPSSGERRRITIPATSDEDRSPAFSPDGRTVAFARMLSLSETDLFTIAFSGGAARGEPKRLTFDRRFKMGPTWTRDGGEIVYGAGQTGNSALWRVRADGSAGPQRMRSIGTDGALPAISRDGRRLAYTRRWRDLDVLRARLPGGVPEPLISSTRSEENARFSPDGSKIAFRSDRSGDAEVWVCDSDGSNAMQLTSIAGANLGGINWSPDGKRIVFASNVQGHGDIYAIAPDGGTPARLTSEASNENMPSWSRDGRWIYFASDRSASLNVWKMPPGGGAAVQVTRNGGLVSSESSDGKWLYYTKNQGPRTDIWRMPLSGGGETRVLESVYWSSFDITADGIYFVAAGRRLDIQFLRFSTGSSEPAVTWEKPAALGLSLSPDRRAILFAVHEQDGADLMLVENFR